MAEKVAVITIAEKRRWSQVVPYAIVGIFLVTVPAYLDVGLVSLITKILIFGLLAMSLDLTFGYAGLWCFGQAALFGVGAYATGVLITHYNVNLFWISATASVLMTVIVAAIFAFIALRVSAFYFLLVTLALGQLVFGVVSKWRSMTQGSDGLGGVLYPNMGFLSPASFSTNSYYYFTLIVFLIGAFLLFKLVNSPFGYSLRGIMENETRMKCLGHNTWLLKFIAFSISGVFAGISGVLYVHYNGLIAPNDVGMMASGAIMLMVIIGGIGTLWGGLVGAAVIMLLQYFIGVLTPERWPLIMGIVFVGVVMFLRGGIFPHVRNLWRKLVRL